MKDTGFSRIKNILTEFPFFEDFTESDLDYFARQLSLRAITAETVLFNQGDIGDYLFFIIKGTVEVSLKSSSSRKCMIASFGYGASVGEMSLVDEFSRSATIVVTEPSELLILTKSRFELINEENPRVGVKTLKGLIKNLSLRLRASSERFADIL